MSFMRALVMVALSVALVWTNDARADGEMSAPSYRFHSGSILLGAGLRSDFSLNHLGIGPPLIDTTGTEVDPDALGVGSPGGTLTLSAGVMVAPQVFLALTGEHAEYFSWTTGDAPEAVRPSSGSARSNTIGLELGHLRAHDWFGAAGVGYRWLDLATLNPYNTGDEWEIDRKALAYGFLASGKLGWALPISAQVLAIPHLVLGYSRLFFGQYTEAAGSPGATQGWGPAPFSEWQDAWYAGLGVEVFVGL